MPYAAEIRAGRRRPHPRHWEALAKLAGVSPDVQKAPNRRLTQSTNRPPRKSCIQPGNHLCSTNSLRCLATASAIDCAFLPPPLCLFTEEEGGEISILEFAATEYGRKGKVVASEDVKAQIDSIGINKRARKSGFDRKNFVRKLIRDRLVHRICALA
jgi:hypothetical protein